MKKLVLLSAGLLAGAASFAQLEKGRVLLGGSVSFSSTETNTNTGFGEQTQKTNGFQFSPIGGVFIRPNLLAGVSLLYGHNKVSASPGVGATSESSVAGGGVLLRRYLPVAGRFYFFVHGGLQYRHSEADFNDNTAGYDANNVTAVVYPGLSYAFGKRILFEAALSNLLYIDYGSTKTRSAVNSGNNPVVKQSGFSAGIGAGGSVPLSIGFNFLLGK